MSGIVRLFPDSPGRSRTQPDRSGRIIQSMVEVYRELLDVLDGGGRAVVCTVVVASGSSPQKVGSKLLVHRDGSIVGTIGGGAIEHAVVAKAAEVLESGRALLFKAHLTRDLAMCCGGRMEVFIEPVGDRPWLVIFGGGHVGAALCDISALAGFRVHVVDQRAEFATSERHPAAAAVTCGEPLEVLGELPFGDDCFVVIVTHDHRLDEQLLHRCAELPTRYLGMIGSRAKVHRFLQRYEAKGIDLRLFDGVHAPIGLDIKARDPGEIAVSVAAELVAVRRGGPQASSYGKLTLVAAAPEQEPVGPTDSGS